MRLKKNKKASALLSTVVSAVILGSVAAPAANAAPVAQVPQAPASQPAAAALSANKNINVTLIGVQLSDSPAANFNKINLNYYRDSINNSSNSFWGWATANRTKMSVQRTIPGFYSKSAHTGQTYVQMKDAVLRDLNYTPGPNEVVVLAVSDTNLRNTDYSRGVEGGGFVYGNNNGVIIMPIQNTLTSSVMTHEFGHVFGIMHANSLTCSTGTNDSKFTASSRSFADRTCYSREYGDSLDVMGLSHQTAPQISAAVWDVKGFGDGREIRNIGKPTKAQTYNLTPWTKGGDNRAVKFTDPANGEVYYLELRSPYGWDSTYAVYGNQGVKITKDDPTQSWDASIVLRPNTASTAYYDPNHTWQQGQTFVTSGGTKVKVNTLTNDVANVTVTPKNITNAPAPAPAPAPTVNAPSIKGEKDLVAVNKANGNLIVQAGDGKGYVGSPQTIGTGWNNAKQVFNVDWNADGTQDVLSTWNNGELKIYYGKKGGGFDAGKVIGKSGWNTVNIAADVFVAGQKYPSIVGKIGDKVYRYQHSSTDVSTRFQIASGKNHWQEIFIADTNRDNKPDLVGRTSAGYLERILGNGTGGLTGGMKVAGSGFRNVDTTTPMIDFKGAGSKGITVKGTDGNVRYYPLGANERYDANSHLYGSSYNNMRVAQ